MRGTALGAARRQIRAFRQDNPGPFNRCPAHFHAGSGKLPTTFSKLPRAGWRGFLQYRLVLGSKICWSIRGKALCWALGLALLPLACFAEAADTLAVNWTPRAALAEEGIMPFAEWTAEVWGNLEGGVREHGWWNSLLDFGVELDTARLGWWEGGSFMVQAHWAQALEDDAFFSDYTGAFNPVSGVMAAAHLRVFNLHYRHAWLGERVVLKAGQIAADDDFMGSDYAGLFLNSAFGAMPTQVGTPLAACHDSSPAFPVYPVAAPGLFLRGRLSKPVYTQLGLYYGRPGPDEWENHGFAWASQSPAELGLFWESGVEYRLVGRAAATRLGLSYHTGPVDDFSGETEAPATRQTVPNYYLIQDVALATTDDGNTQLGLFLRGGITPESDQSMVAMHVDGGIAWIGPVPGREKDAAGVAVAHTRFGGDFRQSTGGRIARAETTLELTYRAQVTDWMALQADAQWLFDPAASPDSGSRETATVIGLRAVIRF